MKEHRLKTLPFYFDDIKAGNKNFDLRKFDRDFENGDILVLEEWRPDGVFIGGYTGRVVRKKIQYILSDCERFGLQNGHCILGFCDCEDARKEVITKFAIAVLAEIAEYAKQEDSPIYRGDKEIDSFVRLSAVNEAINKYLN